MTDQLHRETKDAESLAAALHELVNGDLTRVESLATRIAAEEWLGGTKDDDHHAEVPKIFKEVRAIIAKASAELSQASSRLAIYAATGDEGQTDD